MHLHITLYFFEAATSEWYHLANLFLILCPTPITCAAYLRSTCPHNEFRTRISIFLPCVNGLSHLFLFFDSLISPTHPPPLNREPKSTFHFSPLRSVCTIVLLVFFWSKSAPSLIFHLNFYPHLNFVIQHYAISTVLHLYLNTLF